jgi:hypothetical protein
MNAVVAENEIADNAVRLLASGHQIGVVAPDLQSLDAGALRREASEEQERKPKKQKQSISHELIHHRFLSRSKIHWKRMACA